MSALQQFWHGISPCMEPGIGNCTIAWEAWAVVAGFAAVGIASAALLVAWVGIGVTTASAFAVWKLGVAANNASDEATRIAASEAERSRKGGERLEYRERTEELLVLAQITGEVGTAEGLIANGISYLVGGGVGRQLYLRDSKYRTALFEDLDRLSFPMTAAVRDRLHFLDRKVAGCLLRATGIMAIAQESYRILKGDESDTVLAQVYDGLVFMLPLVRSDLRVVQAACAEAIDQLGLANVKVGRAAAAFASDE